MPCRSVIRGDVGRIVRCGQVDVLDRIARRCCSAVGRSLRWPLRCDAAALRYGNPSHLRDFAWRLGGPTCRRIDERDCLGD